jgi:hypothetical protein
MPTYRTVSCRREETFVVAKLVALMEEGVVDAAPVWDDVGTFDGQCWRGVVDCVTQDSLSALERSRKRGRHQR